jgi:hypothetical protein
MSDQQQAIVDLSAGQRMVTHAPYRPPVSVEWEQSADCGELFAALSKAQGEMEGASKGKENPHFRSKYADLASVWDACRAYLAKNGLCIVQQPLSRGPLAGMRTMLGHSSGQWLAWTSSPRLVPHVPETPGPRSLCGGGSRR